MKPLQSFSRTVWIIGRATYKEAIRERLLYGIFIAAALLTSASFFLATVSLGQDARILENTGSASIQLLALFICIFVTTTSVHRDFEGRVLYFLFPKPVSRTQYVLGKYVGMALFLLTVLVVLGGLFSAGVAAVHPEILHAAITNLSYSFLEISLMIGLSLLFATFTAPLNAALYTLGLYLVGHSQSSVKYYVEQNLDNRFLHGLVQVTYYIMPNLEKFDVRKALLYQVPIPASQVGWTLFYWLILTGIVLTLASLAMRNQEF